MISCPTCGWDEGGIGTNWCPLCGTRETMDGPEVPELIERLRALVLTPADVFDRPDLCQVVSTALGANDA